MIAEHVEFVTTTVYSTFMEIVSELDVTGVSVFLMPRARRDGNAPIFHVCLVVLATDNTEILEISFPTASPTALVQPLTLELTGTAHSFFNLH
jgi:hypothetical protein